jgi:hypothetical protein
MGQRLHNYLWLVLKTAWRHSFHATHTIILVLIIGAGLLTYSLPEKYLDTFRWIPRFDVHGWEVTIIVLVTVIAVRLVSAPYWIWKDDQKLLLMAQAETTDGLQRVRLYRVAFDRPAFKDSFAAEQSLDSFDKAIEDTIVAIATGMVRDREGRELEKLDRGGKSYLTKWISEMNEVTDALDRLRTKYREGEERGLFRFFEHGGWINNPDWDPKFSTEIDDLTVEAIEKMNVVLANARVDLLPTVLKRPPHRARWA